MQRLEFPQAARDVMRALWADLERATELRALVDEWIVEMMDGEEHRPVAALRDAAAALGTAPESLTMLTFLRAARPLYERCRGTAEDEAIYWDSMGDLRYKLMECFEDRGIWGTFTGDWHVDFFRRKRFALGRLQYEWVQHTGPAYEKHGVVLQPGDPLLNMHIPSSGPLTLALRMDSYKRAYAYYKCAERGTPLVARCASWLLYGGNRLFYPPHSNILDFMNDFDLLSSEERTGFSEAWRVFGSAHRLPLEQWPRDTSLRRAYVDWLSAGNNTGVGRGILVFDGERLLTRGPLNGAESEGRS